jgi:hypothetical protein
MPRNNYRKRTRKISNNASASLHPALENLKERLSSPRLKAASTISTYLQTSAKFLAGLKDNQVPTDSDFRRYFIRRRQQGISERTLRKEFFHLKKLAVANNWPFGAEVTPSMTRQKKTRTKALATANKTATRLHPALENLRERLSFPRLRAPGTLISYLVTGANFLAGLKDDQTPTDSDFRRYFIRRREEGISERTLRKEFFHLKKLALANKWEWPFEADDAPFSDEEPNAPALLPAQVEQLIKARAQLSRGERFFLAVATTWIVRREELSRIKKRDYNAETFVIHTAKQRRKVKHIIPDALKPIFADYRPKELSPQALSEMFQRICAKAGLKHRKGYGWDSIRYRLNTLLKDVCLPQNRLNPSLLNDYAHWKQRTGSRYMDTDMTEYYRRPEILDTDPYGIDRVIYSIHPFLPLWGKKQ